MRERERERGSGLSRLAPSVKRVVICVSWAFCPTDQEKRETARSLQFEWSLFMILSIDA